MYIVLHKALKCMHFLKYKYEIFTLNKLDIWNDISVQISICMFTYQSESLGRCVLFKVLLEFCVLVAPAVCPRTEEHSLLF